MYRICTPILALTLALTFSTPTLADEFKHEANVMGKMGNHPNIIQFTGPTTLDVTFAPSAVGDNPLYQGQTMQGENVLYEGAADPGTPTGVQSVSFTLDNTDLTPSSAGNGVVHRDIAARNFLVQTNGGTFQSAPGEFLLFGNDGPPDLRAASGGVGPIRWMAPESLRLYSPGNQGSSNPEHYFDIQPFSSFTTNYVPEPTTATLLLLTSTPLLTRRQS